MESLIKLRSIDWVRHLIASALQKGFATKEEMRELVERYYTSTNTDGQFCVDAWTGLWRTYRNDALNIVRSKYSAKDNAYTSLHQYASYVLAMEGKTKEVASILSAANMAKEKIGVARFGDLLWIILSAKRTDTLEFAHDIFDAAIYEVPHSQVESYLIYYSCFHELESEFARLLRSENGDLRREYLWLVGSAGSKSVSLKLLRIVLESNDAAAKLMVLGTEINTLLNPVTPDRAKESNEKRDGAWLAILRAHWDDPDRDVRRSIVTVISIRYHLPEFLKHKREFVSEAQDELDERERFKKKLDEMEKK